MKKTNKFFNYVYFPIIVAALTGTMLSCNSKIERSPDPLPSVSKNNEVVNLTEDNFDATVANGVVLVDFGATWCKYCKAQTPIINEINEILSGKALICNVDIDQCPNVSSRFQIQGIPVLMIFKNGKAVTRFDGLTAKEDLLAELNKLINNQ